MTTVSEAFDVIRARIEANPPTFGGSPVAYAGGRLTAWFAGAALTATDVANINTALNTYMTAAGET